MKKNEGMRKHIRKCRQKGYIKRKIKDVRKQSEEVCE